jgi:hypothetical protein
MSDLTALFGAGELERVERRVLALLSRESPMKRRNLQQKAGGSNIRAEPLAAGLTRLVESGDVTIEDSWVNLTDQGRNRALDSAPGRSVPEWDKSGRRWTSGSV